MQPYSDQAMPTSTEPASTSEWAYAYTPSCTRDYRAMGYTIGEATRLPGHRGLVWPAVRTAETEAEVRAAIASYGLDYDEVGDRGVEFIDGLLAEKASS